MVMAMQWNAVAGIVNLHEQAHRFAACAVIIAVGGSTEQSQPAVVLFVEAISLQLFRMNNAREHEHGTV